ncbi:MAG: transposase [Prolixibacteraceae bacterium]
MIPKVKSLIIRVLENEIFNRLNKPRKDFIVSVLWHILSIKGRINFLQLGRFSPLCEQTYRNQFEKEFDFLSFNKQLINQTISSECAIALDPSYIPKAGKATYGRGRYWSGVAGAAKWGLDLCGFAVVDIVNNTALHLKAWQTPPAVELAEKGLTLLSYYASLVTENAASLKEYSNYVLADAYFAKRPFVDAVLSTGMHFISRLRDDSVLKYRFTGEPTGKKGAPKKFSGLVDVNNFDPNGFSLDLSNEEITVYSAVVYSKAFKMDIKLAIAIFYKNGTETARKMYFSTDLKQAGEKIVRYYQARFQIEFLYRDAKQHTGLTNCQARGKNKLDFHFNAALTAVNLAKNDWLSTRENKDKPFSMSDYKTQYNNTLMLERFMCMFAINPNTPKNQKIFKELLIYGRIAA